MITCFRCNRTKKQDSLPTDWMFAPICPVCISALDAHYKMPYKLTAGSNPARALNCFKQFLVITSSELAVLLSLPANRVGNVIHELLTRDIVERVARGTYRITDYGQGMEVSDG